VLQHTAHILGGAVLGGAALQRCDKNFEEGLWPRGILVLPSPTLLVVLLSLLIGLLMVLIFGYTSDQRAIRLAKDQLKAHLLAVRLFQDQLPIVLHSYKQIITGTGKYLTLAFKPLLFIILPLTLIIVELDRYLGSTPLQAEQNFLLTAQVTDPSSLNDLSLQLPPHLATTAPAVHIPAENEIVWRLAAERPGTYDLTIATGDHSVSKRAIVATSLARLSPIRLRGQFWKRILLSAEPALADSSPIQSIALNYPSRNLRFAWMDWNWIWLFFVLSLISGFLFKTILGIEI
jgi:hypothetical protein